MEEEGGKTLERLYIYFWGKRIEKCICLLLVYNYFINRASRYARLAGWSRVNALWVDFERLGRQGLSVG